MFSMFFFMGACCSGRFFMLCRNMVCWRIWSMLISSGGFFRVATIVCRRFMRSVMEMSCRLCSRILVWMIMG